MKLKVPVHKNQTKHKFRPFSMYSWANWVGISIIAFVTLITAIIEGWYTLIGMGWLWLFIVYCSQIPAEKGCLKLDKKIWFNSGWGFSQIINYNEIRLLYIGRCPGYFTKPAKGRPAFSKKQWEELYGLYIIAEDIFGNVLFACHDCNEVREFLTEKCRDTAVSIFDEESYAAYHQKLAESTAHLKAIEQQTFAENGGQEILDQYEGYVN